MLFFTFLGLSNTGHHLFVIILGRDPNAVRILALFHLLSAAERNQKAFGTRTFGARTTVRYNGENLDFLVNIAAFAMVHHFAALSPPEDVIARFYGGFDPEPDMLGVLGVDKDDFIAWISNFFFVLIHSAFAFVEG